MTLKFMESFDKESIKKYEESDSFWPTLMDEFYDHMAAM